MPAVLIVTEVLLDMASGTARAAGAPDLEIIMLGEVFDGLSRCEIAERVRPYCGTLDRALVARPE